MFRTARISALAPSTVVLAERSPARMDSFLDCTGATRSSDGHSRAMAAASSSVSVVTLPI
jgi:hypothetical protein